MKNLRFVTPTTLLAFILMVSFGCNDDDTPRDNMVRIHFDHSVSGQQLELNSTWYDCAAGHLFSVERLKYYTSNFVLQDETGATVSLQEVHYRDVEDPATRTLTWDEIPVGTYTSLGFIIGLDEETNVDGGLVNTITNINMEWPLPGDQGYHYMKLEGRYNKEGNGEIKPFNLHTGAAGNNPFYVTISLPFDEPWDLNGGEWDIMLNMDLNEWLQNPNVYDFETFGSMIMANQTAQQTLMENGGSTFSIIDRE